MNKVKKIIAFALFSCLCFSVFALNGVVVDVLGKVEKQNGNTWISLKKGDILSPGDVISTGFKSEAVITVGESTITVRALTRMTIEQLYEKNQNHISSVYLDVGSISADVKPVENKRVGFTVKTPAVTASVRGTAGDVFAYGKVVGIRGKWGLSAPLPKQIDYDRGDAIEADEPTSSTSAETSANVSTSETTTKSSEDSVTNQTEEASSSLNQEDETLTNTEDATPVETEDTSKSEGKKESSLEVKETTVPVVPVEDVDLDAKLAGPAANKEVYVSAGEVAYIKPNISSNTITTPQETKKEEATSLGSSSSVSHTETTVSQIIAPVIVTPTTADIIVEIVIPE